MLAIKRERSWTLAIKSLNAFTALDSFTDIERVDCAHVPEQKQLAAVLESADARDAERQCPGQGKGLR